ncbi:MAG: 8-oxo-dGTP diphosphatase [Sphaerochaeta sp.]|uniref:8-oxo-dGTP diphosphatase n=1 Tax=Sphaerochaeta sp. TaxID=1972642 RepID=UPI002FCC798A
MILETIEQYYTWALIAILLLNFAQRKIPGTNKKRFATIYLASILLLFEVGVVTILARGWNHAWAFLVLAVCIGLLIVLRKRAWPFKLHCVQCHAKLDVNHIIGHDDNLCESCHLAANPQEAAQLEAKKAAVIEEVEPEDPYKDAIAVDAIDWDLWDPKEICVITYLFSEDKVLLIDKKTGLGSGLVNAPGGHIEETETALEAAKREFTEETGLEVDNLRLVGKLNFQFRDGLSERGYVYFADSYHGEMRETEEARPFWCPVSAIPYDTMWEDDRYWLPPALEGKQFEGFFIFDDQKMVDKQVVLLGEDD